MAASNVQIAEREGVTAKTVWLWRKRGVDVSDPEAVRRWRSEHRRGGIRLVKDVSPHEKAPAPPDSTPLGSLAAAKTRLAVEQADWQALRNAERRRELVPLVEHDRIMRETLLPLVEFLETVPAKYGSSFPGDLAANMTVLRRITDEAGRIARREART